MNREQIIDLIDRNIGFEDMKKAGLALSKHYEISTSRMDASDVKNCLSDGHPVAIQGKLIIGFDMQKAFETSDGDFLNIERPVQAIEIKEALPEREYFAITGRNEWGDISEFNSIIGSLRLGEIYLPKHSAIFNFLNPGDKEKKEKIQSVLNGVQINVYNRENYVDNCLHEIGHLSWRTCTRFEEKMQFKELFKHLRTSCIYEYAWERSTEEEVFCTIYKWYMKSVLINKSFYNILEYEEPYGLKLLQSVFDRIAKERIIDDIWEMSREDVLQYLNPPLDKTTGKYIRKSGMLDKIRDIELPESVLNRIESVQNGQAFVGLGKALVPVQRGLIDFEKAKDMSKLTRKQITDKRGHVKTVWVKTGQEEKKESKGSQTDFRKYENNIIARPVKDVGLKYGDKLPENVFLHGSKHSNGEIKIDETKTFYATKDWDIAENYADSGVKAIQLKPNSKVLDLNTEQGRKKLAEILIETDPSMDKDSLIEDFKKMSLHQLGISDNVEYANVLYDANIDAIKDTEGNLDVTNNNCLESYIPEKQQSMQKAKSQDKSIVFLDMDGVVTFFSEHYKNLFNRDVFKDDSFTVTQFCKTEPRFFLTIPVLQRGKDLYDRLAKKYNVIFLTTAMDELEYCRADKVSWIRANICAEPTIIFSANKADYAHSEKDILIDDMDHNLDSFYENGGTAIDFRKMDNDSIMQKIAETLNPQAEIIQIKQQIKEMKVNTLPSEKQKESGVYKKGKIIFKQIPITIENPKGSMRSGIGANGVKWLSKMHSHYGYIKGTEGNDGDEIDCFIGDDYGSNKAFVINQGFSGMFDEHKILLGFNTIEDARQAFLKCYSKGWEKNVMNIVPTNTKVLREWLKTGNYKEPFTGDK